MASNVADNQHLDWLARSFGRTGYAPLYPDDLETLQRVAVKQSKFDRSHLFREGEIATAAYVVVKGTVELYRGTGSNRRVVARVLPGGIIGDIALFSDEPYISSAQAAGHVDLLQFDKEPLLAELARHPAICLRWLAAGLRQLERTQRRVLRLMHRTVKARVADLIIEEGEEVALSQATMAALLGVSRQAVNEAVGHLRDAGLIETGYRRITVVDTAGLRIAADAEYG